MILTFSFSVHYLCNTLIVLLSGATLGDKLLHNVHVLAKAFHREYRIIMCTTIIAYFSV